MNRTRILLASFALFLALAFCASYAYPQQPARTASPRPFEPAEELVYEAEFSRALLRKVDIADFRFTANRTTASSGQSEKSGSGNPEHKSSHVILLTGDVSSKGFFSRLFNLKFRERMESIVDPVSFTVQNTKRLDEQGKRVRKSEAVFDKAAGTVVWTEHDPRNPSGPTRRVTSEFTPPVQDILSAIYYLRTQRLKVGNSFDLSISDSGRVYTVPIRVVEKKRVKSILGRLDSVRIEAILFGPSGMIDSDGQFSIWFTDDSRRIPVSARIKNEYGTFDIKLKKVSRTPGAQEYLTKQ
jgi:uncharacterized protein DUF3108